MVEHNGTVTGVQYKTKNGEELSASGPLTIVCDGCFSNLRRVLCNPKLKYYHEALRLIKVVFGAPLKLQTKLQAVTMNIGLAGAQRLVGCMDLRQKMSLTGLAI
ncbi:hypothetical protein AgCh_017248 [Apium graveolens]